jgi:hypothetical protein
VTEGESGMCTVVRRRDEAWPCGTGARRGSVTLLICFGLVAILGLLALTIDVGRMTTSKSTSQNACDAAALAGAGKLPPAGQTAMDQAALLYLANRTGGTAQPTGTNLCPITYTIADGTTISSIPRSYSVGGDTVTVTNPYQDAFTIAKLWSPYDLLEVRVSRTLQLPFGAAIGVPTAQIVSRAVAWRYAMNGEYWNGGQGCLFALDQGYALSCNTFKVKGSVFSNSDINISMNNYWVGNTCHAKNNLNISGNHLKGHFDLEYGNSYSISSNDKDIGSITKVPQVDVTPPINYDPTKYAQDFHIDTYYNSSLAISASGVTWPAGTYYVKNDLNISANNVDLRNCTFIVGGTVNISTNNLQLSPHENYMCFYVLGSGAINLSQNNISVYGDLYAPNGYINCSSNNIHYGWWVARRIAISCNNFELDGIPGRTSGQNILKLVE